MRFHTVRCSVVVPQQPAVKMRQKRRRKIDVVPRADPRFWTNSLTCVGTAGFEPATP